MTTNNTKKFELPENRGNMFINKDKKTPSHPDYKGTVNVEGKVYFLSGWTTTSKAGLSYLSVSVTEIGDNPSAKTNNVTATPLQSPAPTVNAVAYDELDDEIPF